MNGDFFCQNARFFHAQNIQTSEENQNVKLWLDDFTGKFYPPETALTNKRMYSSHSLHYVVNGSGFFAVEDEKTRLLGAGDIFYVNPGTLVTYYPNPDDPWRYVGISTTAPSASRFFPTVGLSFPCALPACPTNEEIGEAIKASVNRKMRGESGGFELLACLYRVFAILESHFGKNPPANDGSLYISHVKEYIENHYSDSALRISEIAEELHLSHPYLCRIFRRHTGCSVSSYLTDFRLSVARRLLTESNYPVGEIAFLCGYTDPIHFSKMYKRQYGLSPTLSRVGGK